MTMTDIPRARVTDPLTSHQAAESVAGVSTRQGRIYEIIANSGSLWTKGGLTDEQIYAEYTERFGYISQSGCRTRRKELCDVGQIANSGLTRTTASGRKTIVWVAT